MLSHKSSWRDSAVPHNLPALEASQRVDVAIIGGGITGITAAYLLKDTGLTVAVMEADTIGAWASGSTTAFLMELIDTDAQELIQTRGAHEAKQILDSHRDAVSFYEATITAESIECEFMRCPAYYYAHSKSERETLQQEQEALQSLDRKIFYERHGELPFKHFGYLKINDQAKFHPLKYLFELVAVTQNTEINIYEHAKVDALIPNGERIALRCGTHTVEARWVLMATHYPMAPQPTSLFFKKAAYMTYVLEARIAPNRLPEALYEDTYNPYHYFRVDRAGAYDRLIIGGEDHRKDIPVPQEKNFLALREYLCALLPDASVDVQREWKGQIVEPGDGLAFIGPVTLPNLFYATGYSGVGLTYAVIAAQLFKDFVLDKDNSWQSLYAADRIFNASAYVQSAEHYLEEFAGGALKNMFAPNKKYSAGFQR